MKSWAFATAAIVLLLVSVVGLACGGTGAKQAKTGETPSGPSTPQITLAPADATATFELIATVVAELRQVPVISQESAPGWQEEGEPRAKLTQVCPSAVQRQPLAEDASRLLRRATGEQAGSSAVIYLEFSDGGAYARELFGGAATCAQALVRAWFDETTQFDPNTTQAGVGGESVLVQSASGATPAAALFFRRQAAVAAVAVVGPEGAQLVGQLAAVLDGAIDQKLQSLIQGTPLAE